MSKHVDASGQNNVHPPYAFSFASASTRAAGTGYTLAASDVGKIARQTDDNTLWMLLDDSPITWVCVGLAVCAVRVYRNTTQTISTGTSTAVSYDTEVYDHGGLWAIGNPTRLVAPVNGIYSAVSSVEFVANATGARFHFWKKNGTTDIGPSVARLGDGAQDYYNRFLVTCQVKLAAGEYLEAIVNQASGGNLNLTTSADFHPLAMMALVSGY